MFDETEMLNQVQHDFDDFFLFQERKEKVKSFIKSRIIKFDSKITTWFDFLLAKQITKCIR